MTNARKYLLIWPIMFAVLIYIGAWYDTAHMHVLTAPLNLFIESHLSLPVISHEYLDIITGLGEKPVFIVVIGILLLALADKREWKAVLYCLITVFVVTMVTKYFKHMIYSPRPLPYSNEVESFPSGHTMRATLWCGLLLMMEKLRYIKLPRFTWVFLIIVPLAVGISRIALDRHWLTDVIGAYALTLALMWVLYAVFSQKKAPV